MVTTWTTEVDDDLYTLYRDGGVFLTTNHDAVGWGGFALLEAIAQRLNDEGVR